jgi:hypothetical protein
MGISKDIANVRFGRLTALEKIKTSIGGHAIWKCICDCGSIKEVSGVSLRGGDIVSCGCYRREKMRSTALKHGNGRTGKHTPEYNVWLGIKARCTRPGATAYDQYGGRGINVCDRWLDFVKFLEDMGERPPGTTIDRINNDLGYEPKNCRWATKREQSKNRKITVFYEYNGKRLTLSEWSEELGIKRITLYTRISLGWTIDRVLGTPLRRKRRIT